MKRPIHPDFLFLLGQKDSFLVNLFDDLRDMILEIYPDANELLYHTHALSAVFSTSDKVSDAFCHIPVYSEHLNLGFNKGALLDDPHKLLTGTGKLIRHIAITDTDSFRNEQVEMLIKAALELSINEMSKASTIKGQTISKIKKS